MVCVVGVSHVSALVCEGGGAGAAGGGLKAAAQNLGYGRLSTLRRRHSVPLLGEGGTLLDAFARCVAVAESALQLCMPLHE